MARSLKKHSLMVGGFGEERLSAACLHWGGGRWCLLAGTFVDLPEFALHPADVLLYADFLYQASPPYARRCAAPPRGLLDHISLPTPAAPCASVDARRLNGLHQFPAATQAQARG